MYMGKMLNAPRKASNDNPPGSDNLNVSQHLPPEIEAAYEYCAVESISRLCYEAALFRSLSLA